MIPVLSVVSSVKDYLEVVHKLIDSDVTFSSYTEMGPMITYFVLSFKQFIIDFFSFSWLRSAQSISIVIPDISAAMISEISVLDGYFHNAFNFLDTPGSALRAGENGFFSLIEKFSIGIINSLFLFLPTSTAHIITLRRFVVQGLSAGFISGLGTIAGNVFWLASVILGWRFFVIPWLSLDIFRYLLGFVLLVNYMWDSYKSQKNSSVLTQTAKTKIFLLTFLLSLTEQTSIYPFISNISMTPAGSLLEGFAADNYGQFILVHFAYLLGITVGSFSLLQLSCWFWENPFFKLYMWVISSFKVSTSTYYKVINFVFLYLTMISAIASIPYYSLDYTLTNPLGYQNDDRIIQDKVVLETSFLGGKASDRNTRRNRGRHGRRERWKRRIRKYRTFDTSLYDQGIYDLFTIEDLNYGFDRFWLRRKLRNHRVRFRFFPGPWMRSFKKQLAKPRLESYTGPRIEFFRILFEQVYHPSFHEKTIATRASKDINPKTVLPINTNRLRTSTNNKNLLTNNISNLNQSSIYKNSLIKKDFKTENSALRKFVRKLDTRLKSAVLTSNTQFKSLLNMGQQKIYSKRWKDIFSNLNLSRGPSGSILLKNENRNFYYNTLTERTAKIGALDPLDEKQVKTIVSTNSLLNNEFIKKQSSLKQTLSNKDYQILRYRSTLGNNLNNEKMNNGENSLSPLTLLHPLKFYLKNEYSFTRKLRYYTPNVFRKFSVENNAPYFRVMMRRYFYNYKATNRWERTMKVASMRKARRKTTRTSRKLTATIMKSSRRREERRDGGAISLGEKTVGSFAGQPTNLIPGSYPAIVPSRITKPTSSYSVVSKRASRYRYQIYKDVMQHWYYSPFNRFLLKLDVDSFIRRQPNSHFLTNKEENLLHLRRFLLSSHYNTLRWYTNMEHYRSMKTKIGYQKSFSSRAYNQQFTGTFKKIRHLFAITPENGLQANSGSKGVYNADTRVQSTRHAPPTGASGSEVSFSKKGTPNVLKFDQALYNEYPNKEKSPLLNMLVIHEELIGDNDFKNQQNKDLVSQSEKIVKDYLINANGERNEYKRNLLKQNNYTALTQFIYNGQKLRGTSPTTNQRQLLNQEKEYLLTNSEKTELENQILKERFLLRKKLNENLMEDLYTQRLRVWKRRVNNPESLKNYLIQRIDKREKRKSIKEKMLMKKFDNLSNWILNSQNNEEIKKLVVAGQTNTSDQRTKGIVSPLKKVLNTPSINYIEEKSETNNQTPYGDAGSHPAEPASISLTSGLQKAIAEGTSVLDRKKQNYIELINLSTLNKANPGLRHENFSYLETGPEGPFMGAKKVFLNDISLIKKQLYKKEINVSLNKLNTILNRQRVSKLGKAKPVGLYNQTLKTIKGGAFSIYQKLNSTLGQLSLLGLREMNSIIKPIHYRSLATWRQKQRALGKQKRLRKEFKLIFKAKEKANIQGQSNIERKKRIDDYSIGVENDNNQPSSFNTIVNGSSTLRERLNLRSFGTNYIGFKREKLPQRRYRSGRRGRGPIKKRTLSDSFKKDINLFLTNKVNSSDFYNKLATDPIRVNIITNGNSNFKETILKKRNNKQRTHRSWKQKRTTSAQRKHRKYLKRRRYAVSKIRVLSKQLKRIKNQVYVQNWWWKQYIPSIQASTDALWQIEKDRLIQQKLDSLSILAPKAIKTGSSLPQPIVLDTGRKAAKTETETSKNELQVGNKDFKPLALPQTTRYIEEGNHMKTDKIYSQFRYPNTSTLKINELNDSGSKTPLNNNNGTSSRAIRGLNLKGADIPAARAARGQMGSPRRGRPAFLNENQSLIFNKLYSNIFIKDLNLADNFSANLLPNTNLPFYAGWDESLRKFVVTNRLLSRQDAGFVNFTIPLINKDITTGIGAGQLVSKEKSTLAKPDSVTEFTQAPLKGMNAATTLYWQIPFTTYDPDQFFALGLDGFSPLSWRKFLFRHSILKSWLTRPGEDTYNLTTTSPPAPRVARALRAGQSGPAGRAMDLGESMVDPFIPANASALQREQSGRLMGRGIYGAEPALIQSLNQINFNKKLPSLTNNLEDNNFAWQQTRRFKKRLQRIKKHPRTPVWFPSGSLMNQVLPVHYIYVFYKRSRLPRYRYLHRRLLNMKTALRYQNSETLNILKYSNSSLFKESLEFTLRKRLKPKRKYHLKHDPSIVIPRRFQFLNTNTVLKGEMGTYNLQTEMPPAPDRGASRGTPQGPTDSFAIDGTSVSNPTLWRPLSSKKLNKPISSFINEQKMLRSIRTQRLNASKDQNDPNKQSNEPVTRLKQLRRRVQRQVLRSVWRNKPRTGGFVWPGDYLKLELVKAPTLKTGASGDSNLLVGIDSQSTTENGNRLSSKRKTKRKKKRTLIEWQIQPKKYLYEKHNIKVLKKKLEKSLRNDKINEKVKQLSLKIE